jgi:hypothetical protein
MAPHMSVKEKSAFTNDMDFLKGHLSLLPVLQKGE